ncbi:MAG TPA: carbamoyl phosphate synthase large subunit, partial [Anaeromyxobacteraceae bacterium]|nr:carbamoyl phosphate synthase large subunit [Anaeromyxobacteraceae bacterium]
RSRELDSAAEFPVEDEDLLAALERPSAQRFDQVLEAFRRGIDVESVHGRCLVDRWFLRELEALAREGDGTEGLVRAYKAVDTCAAEFEAATPYYYSGHERPRHDGSPPANEIRRGENDSVVILGAGPNRIGQGIEFDYCCVQAALALRDDGFETIMVNSNPETVSTDFDISDKLYFEPLTVEDVFEIIDREKPEGVIVQLGGQTPLKLAGPLAEMGVPILGTTVESIDRAEDRDRFAALCREIGATVPPNGMAESVDDAARIANEIGYPVLLRPSYVIGGRAMEIVYDEESLRHYFAVAARAMPGRPVLIDRFLEDAFEADVDAIADGRDVIVA